MFTHKCMHVCVCARTYVISYMWRPKENFLEMVLSFKPLGSEDQTQIISAKDLSQLMHVVSAPTSLFFKAEFCLFSCSEED